MSKSLALAVALLVALIALAGATTYTTTVITTAGDKESDPGQSQQCRQQIQGRQFRSCQRYFSQGSYGGGGSEEETGEEIMGKPSQDKQSLRECCQQLRYVNEQCQCEAVRQAVRQLQQGGSGQQVEELQQVYEKASKLPSKCGFRQQQCQIWAVFV